MLVEFKVTNFRSFREEQTLRLTASNITELPQNTFTDTALDDIPLLRSAVVYGPNASGKSNLVNAISVMRSLILGSARISADSLFPHSLVSFENVVPFRLDKISGTQPTTWEITFLQDGVRYQYGFSVAEKIITHEFLTAYPNKVGQRWFERRPATGNDDGWSFSDHLRGEKKRISGLTRPDALFLSVAAQLNHQHLSPLYNWFRDKLRIVDNAVNRLDALEATIQLVSENEENCDVIAGALSAADLGIDGFEIRANKPELEEPQAFARTSEGRLIPVSRARRPLPVINTFHPVVGSTEKIAFDLRRDESLGTRRFFGLIGHWMRAIRSAQVIFTDELDASMHPMLTRFLVNLFNDPAKNRRNAQAVFTTHDTTLLDNSIFRRDQIWFTEKDKEGASHIYSLFDFRPRKAESLQKGYLTGRYGALPFIGEAFF
jgi:uncharacterized protein